MYTINTKEVSVKPIFASQGLTIHSAPLQPLADLANVYMACVFLVLVFFLFTYIVQSEPQKPHGLDLPLLMPLESTH